MKILIFCATEEDRRLYWKYNKNALELSFDSEDLTLDNVMKTKGYQAVVILTRCIVNEEMAEKLSENGVKYVLTRSAGYDHMDLQAVKKYGLKAANVALYSPNAIAEYVCMVSLMAIRKAKKQLQMIDHGDFSLAGIRSLEMRNLTIGIVGMGRIGFETLKIFSAFTSDILVYDLYQKEEVKKMASYVSIEELYEKSDLIIYHCPLTTENHHMVSKETISQMKDGVILINPARGGLWDYQAIADGITTGKISSAAFDVYEDEKKYLRKKIPNLQELDPVFAELIQSEKIIYTAHSAFYTDTAIENMIEVTLDNLTEYMRTDSCKNELIRTA